MKTLKKLTSLVLAAAMSASLFTAAASAEDSGVIDLNYDDFLYGYDSTYGYYIMGLPEAKKFEDGKTYTIEIPSKVKLAPKAEGSNMYVYNENAEERVIKTIGNGAFGADQIENTQTRKEMNTSLKITVNSITFDANSEIENIGGVGGFGAWAQQAVFRGMTIKSPLVFPDSVKFIYRAMAWCSADEITMGKGMSESSSYRWFESVTVKNFNTYLKKFSTTFDELFPKCAITNFNLFIDGDSDTYYKHITTGSQVHNGYPVFVYDIDNKHFNADPKTFFDKTTITLCSEKVKDNLFNNINGYDESKTYDEYKDKVIVRDYTTYSPETEDANGQKYRLIFTVKNGGKAVCEGFDKTSPYGVPTGIDLVIPGTVDSTIEGEKAADLTAVSDKAFINSNCSDNCINTLTIGESTEPVSLGYRSFAGLKALTKVSLPGKTTYIGEQAFWDANAINIVEIGGTNNADALTIAKQAFGNCKRMISINLPANVVINTNDVFYNCVGLSYVYLNGVINAPSDFCETSSALSTKNKKVMVYAKSEDAAALAAKFGISEKNQDGTYTLTKTTTPVYLSALPQTASLEHNSICGIDEKNNSVQYSAIAVAYEDADAENTKLYIAQYNKDGLANIAVCDIGTLKTGLNVINLRNYKFMQLTNDYKLNDKYTYKAFLWNGENIAPLCDALTIVNN